MIIQVILNDRMKKDFPSLCFYTWLGQTTSTVGEEKRYNTRLVKPREDFVHFMKELKLSYPLQIGNIVL